MERYDLNGKVALVTGAARGIGFETARQMHLRGASVAVLDLDADEAREAAERIGPRAIGLGGDVTDQSALMNAVATVVEEFGGLDVAVANAGIAQKQFATVRGISGEEWERVFEVDMLGVWRTVRATLPQIVERKGQMIVVSSVYAFANGFGNSPYAVAKAGVESLGRALRVELRPHGASASVAYFGWVDTKLVQDAFAQEDAARLQELSPEWLRRRITPEEAGAGLVKGIEERAPRIFVPKWWRYVSALRGLVNPCSTSGWRATRRHAPWSATSTRRASISPNPPPRVRPPPPRRGKLPAFGANRFRSSPSLSEPSSSVPRPPQWRLPAGSGE